MDECGYKITGFADIAVLDNERDKIFSRTRQILLTEIFANFQIKIKNMICIVITKFKINSIKFFINLVDT